MSAAAQLFDGLRALGLQHVRTLTLTRNRSVVVSLRGHALRVHEGFASASPDVHAAIVRFVMARRRDERLAARKTLIAHPLPRTERPPRAPERTHPEDAPIAECLAEWHARLNDSRFGAALETVPIRVSRRMRKRLGHYAPRAAGLRAEIAISERHVARDGLDAAVETLLHEMVHQWQHERGLPIDHSPTFRRKCREVGAPAAAKRA